MKKINNSFRKRIYEVQQICTTLKWVFNAGAVNTKLYPHYWIVCELVKIQLFLTYAEEFEITSGKYVDILNDIIKCYEEFNNELYRK